MKYSLRISQLHLILESKYFNKAGVKIYAASVDTPEAAGPIQEYVGEKITILCNLSETLLNDIGVRDQRGAPWYDRILFGALKQDIAMPAAFMFNKDGKIVFAERSLKVDNRPNISNILDSLKIIYFALLVCRSSPFIEGGSKKLYLPPQSKT
jgi:peroxiredoxin